MLEQADRTEEGERCRCVRKALCIQALSRLAASLAPLGDEGGGGDHRSLKLVRLLLDSCWRMAAGIWPLSLMSKPW